MQQLLVLSFGPEAVPVHCWSYTSPAASEPKVNTTTHPVGDSCFRVSISVNCTACPPPLVLKTSPWEAESSWQGTVTRSARLLQHWLSYENCFHEHTWKKWGLFLNSKRKSNIRRPVSRGKMNQNLLVPNSSQFALGKYSQHCGTQTLQVFKAWALTSLLVSWLREIVSWSIRASITAASYSYCYWRWNSTAPTGLTLQDQPKSFTTNGLLHFTRGKTNTSLLSGEAVTELNGFVMVYEN